MKKVVYLAPIFLLSFLGKNAMANQVDHVSNLDSALEQASATNKDAIDTNRNTTVLQNQVLRINKTNQTAIPDSIKQSTGFQDEKIAANTNVTINDLANNKVHVHYVDANGNAVDNSSHDYTIDVAKTGQGSYTVPSGYQLNYPDGKYTVSGGAFNGTNLKGNVWHTEAETEPDYSNLTTGNRYIDTILKNRNMMKPNAGVFYETEGQGGIGSPYLNVYSDHATGIAGSSVVYSYAIDGSYGHEEIRSTKLPNKDAVTDTSDILDFIHNYGATSSDNDFVVRGKVGTKAITPAYDAQQLPVAFVDSNNNIVGMIQNYTGKVGTTQNVSLTVPTGYKLADGASLPTSVTFQNSTNPLLVKVVPSGKTQRITNNTINVKFVDQESGQQVGTDVISLTKAHDGTNYYNTPAGYGTDVNSYHVDNGVRYETGIYLVQLGKTVYPDSPNGYDSRLANAIFSNLPGGDFNLEYYHKGDYLTAGYHGRKLDLSTDDVHYWRDLMLSVGKGKVWKGFDTEIRDGDVDTGKRSFTDNLHTISGNTVTVPVHRTNSFTFSDNSGNVKSYSGNTVNVILEHQTKRIDPNNSSLDLDANNQLHLINTSQEQPKQSTTNFKVGYLLDLVTNNKIIDTNNAQALNNTKIFTVNPSLPIGYDALNSKLLVLNL